MMQTMSDCVLGSLVNGLAQRSDLLLECNLLARRQRQQWGHGVQAHVHDDVASQPVLDKHLLHIIEC